MRFTTNPRNHATEFAYNPTTQLQNVFPADSKQSEADLETEEEDPGGSRISELQASENPANKSMCKRTILSTEQDTCGHLEEPILE